MKNTTRSIKVGDVFYHKNKFFQRKVVDVLGDDICYHDGFGYGRCSRGHFLSICPREVKVNPKRKLDEYAFCSVEETVNGILDDNAR